MLEASRHICELSLLTCRENAEGVLSPAHKEISFQSIFEHLVFYKYRLDSAILMAVYVYLISTGNNLLLNQLYQNMQYVQVTGN